MHNMEHRKMLVFFICFSGTFCLLLAYEPTWDSLDSRPLPAWYDEAKFGIFMHWGVYSVPGKISEWFWWDWKGENRTEAIDFMKKSFRPNFSYAEFGPMFRAELFDPDQFAGIIKRSGAKYFVFTSKHHEGFTMYPSNYSWNWNSKDLGPNRDLLGDLKTSFTKIAPEIRFGLYYSLYEWFHSLYLKDKSSKWKAQEYVNMVAWPQLMEIVNQYKPEVVWSDGDWEAPDTYWKSKEFLAWLYTKSPVKDTVISNDRWGDGVMCNHGGFYTCSDRFNPGTLQKHKWENCFTVDRNSWGYRRDMTYADILSIEEIVEQLASTISCGGNLLMNVGPTSDGRIAPIFEERLYQLGDFLQVNREAVYQSKPWIYQNDTLTPGIWYTSQVRNVVGLDPLRIFNPQDEKNTIVYAFVLKWPPGDKLKLGVPKASPKTTISMLGVSKSLHFESMSEAKGLRIDLSSISFSELPSTHSWVIKMEYLKNDNHDPFWESAKNKGSENFYA